jgi:hypothetical protein
VRTKAPVGQDAGGLGLALFLAAERERYFACVALS